MPGRFEQWIVQGWAARSEPETTEAARRRIQDHDLIAPDRGNGKAALDGAITPQPEDPAHAREPGTLGQPGRRQGIPISGAGKRRNGRDAIISQRRQFVRLFSVGGLIAGVELLLQALVWYREPTVLQLRQRHARRRLIPAGQAHELGDLRRDARRRQFFGQIGQDRLIICRHEHGIDLTRPCRCDDLGRHAVDPADRHRVIAASRQPGAVAGNRGLDRATADLAGDVVLGDRWADIEKSYPGDSWDDPLRGNFNALITLKELHPHVKTLISVGGWTWSGRFSDVALTEAARSRFAASCVDFMIRYGFDGVDIDWEYPVVAGQVFFFCM